MVVATLLASGVVYTAAGGAMVVVGARFRRRHVERESRIAAEAFALHWIVLGVYTALWGGLFAMLASAGLAPFLPFLALRYVGLLGACVAIGALTYYFAYLFTGRKGWLYAIVPTYAVVAFVAEWNVWRSHPVGVDVQTWRADLVYSTALRGSTFDAILLLLIVPPLLGVVGYAVVAARARDPDHRTRGLLAATAVGLWYVLAVAARASENDLWQLVTRPVGGLAAATIALYAFRAHRFGLSTPVEAGRAEALAERVRQLI